MFLKKKISSFENKKKFHIFEIKNKKIQDLPKSWNHFLQPNPPDQSIGSHGARQRRTYVGVQHKAKARLNQMVKRASSESLTQSAKKPRARSTPASAAGTATTAIFILLPSGITRATGLFACDSGGWDVTPSEAYTWSYAPPQGCTCQETGVPLADCKAS